MYLWRGFIVPMWDELSGDDPLVDIFAELGVERPFDDDDDVCPG